MARPDSRTDKNPDPRPNTARSNSPRRTTKAKKRSPIRQIHAKKAVKAVMPEHFTGAQDRYLRGLGHDLEPVVMIGKEGISDALVAQTKTQLKAHELIKVRIQTEAPDERKAAAEELARRTGAHLAQVLGRTFLLFLVNPEKSRISLPDGKASKSAKAAKAAADDDGDFAE